MLGRIGVIGSIGLGLGWLCLFAGMLGAGGTEQPTNLGAPVVLPDLNPIRQPVDDSAYIAATSFVVVGALFAILFWLLKQRAADWKETRTTLMDVIKANTQTNSELNSAVNRLSEKIDEEKKATATHPCLLLTSRKYRDKLLDLIEEQSKDEG